MKHPMHTEANLKPLPDEAIYADIDAFNIRGDFQSWKSSESKIFDKLVEQHKPTRIIEVGSHKGVSACTWAMLAGEGCKIFCVDTWLEAAEAAIMKEVEWNRLFQNAHPMTYWTFLKNVKDQGLTKQIVPIINTSAEGAIILAAHKITAPIIYIDASHTYLGAYRDLCDYWPLLEKGGSMLVDDLSVYLGVYTACIRFSVENGLWDNFEVTEDKVFGLFKKP